MKKQKIKIYTGDEIQIVYERHKNDPKSVVYSDSFGNYWKSPPLDSGKWNMKWWFAFLELENSKTVKK